MVKSTFISIGLHVFLILIAYYGLPSFKVKEPIEQPIDIVEDTPHSLLNFKVINKNGKFLGKIVRVDKNDFQTTLYTEIVIIPYVINYVLNVSFENKTLLVDWEDTW